MTNKPVPSFSLFSSIFSSTSLFAAALSLVAGCVTDGESTAQDPPDEQDATQAVASIIKIQADTDLSLVLFREGVNGAWHRATRISGSRYQALVRGPYTVLTVCEVDGSPTTGITSATLQDPRLVEMQCVFEQSSFPFVVSGNVAQAGQATLGRSTRISFAPNWTFHLAAEARPTDFLVSGGGYAVRRTVPVTGDLTLPPIDTVAQGTQLVSSPVTVTNALPGEVLEGNATLINAAQERLRLYRGAMPPKLAPASLLVPGDTQMISVDADVDAITPTGQSVSYHGASRNAQVGQSFSLALWRPFAAVPQLSFDALGDDKVTWQASDLDLPRNIGFDHYVFDNLGVFIYHTISPSYVKQTKISSMTVPTHVPGFKDAWRVDRTDYSRNFVTTRENPVTHERDGYGFAEYVYPTFGTTFGTTFSSTQPLAAERPLPSGDARVERLRDKYRVE